MLWRFLLVDRIEIQCQRGRLKNVLSSLLIGSFPDLRNSERIRWMLIRSIPLKNKLAKRLADELDQVGHVLCV
jgi:hypothetical protein